MENRHLVRRARGLLIGATLFWGASFPLMRGLQLAQHVPHIPDAVVASTDLAMRFGLAALILLPFYGRALFRGVTSCEWSQSLGLGLLASGGIYLQTLGLAWTDASISAFLTQVYMLIVPLIVAARDRRWPSWRIVLACGMVLAGAAFLSPGLFAHFILGRGEIVTLLGTGFFAALIVWVERPLYAQNRSGVVTLLMFSTITLVSVALCPILGGGFHSAFLLFDRPAPCILMLTLVLFCTVLGFYVMNTWQRFISATEAGLIYCLEPVIASILAAFLPGWISRLAGISYPNEALHAGLFIGGGLIVGATVLAATQRLEPKS